MSKLLFLAKDETGRVIHVGSRLDDTDEDIRDDTEDEYPDKSWGWFDDGDGDYPEDEVNNVELQPVEVELMCACDDCCGCIESRIM